MNFQTTVQANGQLTTILATVLEVGTSKLNKNNKPYQSAKLRDDNDEEHTLTINKGSGRLLDNNCLGQRLQFAMQTYAGQTGTAYAGYWNDTAQVNQIPTPQGQQATPDATGTAKSPAPAPDSEMIRMRSMALAYAKDLVCAEQLIIGDLKSKADEFTAYIAHGKWFVNKTTPEDEPTDTEDIPF